MVTLIPAFEPDHRLVTLVEGLRQAQPETPVVVVDDGSGPRYRHIFDAVHLAGAEVLAYEANRGKGFALRTGLAHVVAVHPGHGVVSADCDGQHTADDIARIGLALAQRDDRIVLGSRQFTGTVPIRSRFGNTVTRHVFDAVTGRRIHDTQTGLRGYPAPLLGWLQRIPGDRFEYELEILLEAERSDITVTEIPISTIYEDTGSSHFRTIRDSVRVYLPLVKFSLSSLAAFVIDLTVFFSLMAMTGSLGIAAVVARVTSATFNFTANRNIVFGARTCNVRRAALRYGLLVLSLLAVNYLVLSSLVAAGLAVAAAKLTTEMLLFVLSYQVQRRVVFRTPRPVHTGTETDAAPTTPTVRSQPRKPRLTPDSSPIG